MLSGESLSSSSLLDCDALALLLVLSAELLEELLLWVLVTD